MSLEGMNSPVRDACCGDVREKGGVDSFLSFCGTPTTVGVNEDSIGDADFTGGLSLTEAPPPGCSRSSGVKMDSSVSICGQGLLEE